MTIQTSIRPKRLQSSRSNFKQVEVAIQLPQPNEWLGRKITPAERDRVEKAASDLVLAWWSVGPSVVQAPSSSKRGVQRLLNWLERFEGESYQDKWIASGANNAGRDWCPPEMTASKPRRWECRLAGNALIVIGVIRPDYTWVFCNRQVRLWEDWAKYVCPDEWEQLRRTYEAEGTPERVRMATRALLIRTCIVHGVTFSGLEPDHLVDVWKWHLEHGRSANNAHTAWMVCKVAGFLTDAPPSMSAVVLKQPLEPDALVDQYGVESQVIRNVLVEYFSELSTTLDWSSQNNKAHQLVQLFWRDIELNNPGLDTLVLSQEQTKGWKKRLREPRGKVTSRESLNVMAAVRSMYLDIGTWAHENPEKWGPWAAPNPVSDSDIRGLAKERAHTKHRMQARTRSLAPYVNPFVTAAADQHHDASRVLELARASAVHEIFIVRGIKYMRRQMSRSSDPNKISVEALDTGEGFDPVEREESAFWAWSAIEVLRHTGLRIEELTELTHLSIKQFRKPDNTIIPLLQVAPSKNDKERILPCSPELTTTLARIINRIIREDGTIPLCSRHNQAQRDHGPLLPHLFQMRRAGRSTVFSDGTFRKWFREIAEKAELCTADGLRVKFTPHDFRRLFITDLVNDGFPIHLAAQLVGHSNIGTTRDYTAVYQKDVFEAYNKFISNRRSLRPSSEYRQPTQREWGEFEEHFLRRRVSLGTCHRSYGSSCVHEHACIRCQFLECDPAQAGLLEEIETNVEGRIAEAQSHNWLGDVDQLTITLRSLRDKKEQLRTLTELTVTQPVTMDTLAPTPPTSFSA